MAKEQKYTSRATQLLQANPELRETVQGSQLFQQLKRRKSVKIDEEDFFVVEGDTLLDEDQLAFYAAQREKADEAFKLSRSSSDAGLGMERLTAPVLPSLAVGLIGMTVGGKVVRWESDKILEYRVARSTFLSDERYEKAKKAVAEATGAWEETCGVKFGYRPDLDDAAGVGPAGALFSVREFDAGGQFIASAFFPTDPPNRRKVLLDPSFFETNLSFDTTGVLRHELGHVLGFRHEHIRSGAPPVCPGEPLDDTVLLTDYDPQSVMHYFCGNKGTRELRISALDRIGAQQVYGPPLASIQFIK
jgi:hypothetical protein